MRKYIITPIIAILWALISMLTGGNKATAVSSDDICYETKVVIEEVTKTGVREVERSREVDIPGSDEVSHKEFQYKRVVPAVEEESYETYEWTRTLKAQKQVQLPNGTHNNQNHQDDFLWQGVWYHPQSNWGQWVNVPDSLQPPHYGDVGESGTFGVGNKPYGLPSQYSVQWKYLIFEPEIEWSVDKPEGDGWVKTGKSETVVTQEAQPEQTFYYLPGGGESTDLTDTNWTVDDVDTQVWERINNRKVVDQEAVPPSTKTVYWTEEEEFEYIEEVETEVVTEVECEVVVTTTVPPATTTPPPDTTVPPTTVAPTPAPVTPTTVQPAAPVDELPATGTASGVIFTTGLVVIFVGGILYLMARPGRKI